MKRIVVIALIVLVIGLGAWAWLAFRAKSAGPGETAPATAKVARGGIELCVEATGSVESNLDVDIKCKASGEIVTLPYDISDRVQRYVPGQNDQAALLVALNPIDEQRRVMRAQSQRDVAKARHDQAVQDLVITKENLRISTLETAAGVLGAKAKNDLMQLTHNRQRDLFQRQVATQDEVDNSGTAAKIADADYQISLARQEALKSQEMTIQLRQADVELAGANLASAEVDLADVQQRLTETKIYSPIDGVITGRNVEIGQIVASGTMNIGGGTTLMTVSDLSRIFVTASVDESDIGRLVETQKVGQEVVITADAYTGRRFQGTVVQITPRGVNQANVVTFAVKIEILGEGKELLLPKMTANVTIKANSKTDALLIPYTAIHYDQDQPYAEVRMAGKNDRRALKLGLNDGVKAEVIEGVYEGEEVVLGAASTTSWSNEGKSHRPATRPTTAPTSTTMPSQPASASASAPASAPATEPQR